MTVGSNSSQIRSVHQLRPPRGAHHAQAVTANSRSNSGWSLHPIEMHAVQIDNRVAVRARRAAARTFPPRVPTNRRSTRLPLLASRLGSNASVNGGESVASVSHATRLRKAAERPPANRRRPSDRQNPHTSAGEVGPNELLAGPAGVHLAGSTYAFWPASQVECHALMPVPK